MLRAGLELAALQEVNPCLIYARLSGFGHDKPCAGRGGFDPRASRQPSL
jgi:crotonobetainyl-CoA:carnitine CoA-transferase CaiB-like acyl-CoA transferase